MNTVTEHNKRSKAQFILFFSEPGIKCIGVENVMFLYGWIAGFDNPLLQL